MKADLPKACPGLLSRYEGLVREGVLVPDPAQRPAMLALEELGLALEKKPRPRGILGRLLSRRAPSPRGLYIWGDVGRGKTLLMDMFFEGVQIADKRRVHFHEFMAELHQDIAEIRQGHANGNDDLGGRDPIGMAVRPIIESTSLLCFDEFHVSDITNAMILGRLFQRLFDGGVVVVATSNVAPDRLYHNGLNRQLFLPFIELLKKNCRVLHLQAQKDYRLDRLSARPVFHFGDRDKVAAELERHWRDLTGGKGKQTVVRVPGREISVPEAGMGCARFAFADLCEKPLGARDYLVISHCFHTLMIEGIPVFDASNSNAAKRFIILIDTLYDRGVKLVAGFDESLLGGELERLSGDKNTAFEFRRTISRLREMASSGYLARELSDQVCDPGNGS